MCVALLYSVRVCVCVCTCERNTSARCISCWFVFCSNFIQANTRWETLCTPEGLISPLWKDVVALKCVFRARKHPDSSALLSQRESSSGRLGQPVPRGGSGISWPWRQGLACKFGGKALIRSLCLCCFSQFVEPLDAAISFSV